MGFFNKAAPAETIEGIVERYGLGGMEFGQGHIVLRGDTKAYVVVWTHETKHEMILTQPGDKVSFSSTGGDFVNLTMREMGIHR